MNRKTIEINLVEEVIAEIIVADLVAARLNVLDMNDGDGKQTRKEFDALTEVLEYYGHTDPPVMLCLPQGDDDGNPTWSFYCNWCARMHNHGGSPGHRVAHCNKGAPMKAHGYILKLRDVTDSFRIRYERNAARASRNGVDA